MGGVFFLNVNIGYVFVYYGWAYIVKFNSIGDGSVLKRLLLGIILDMGLGGSGRNWVLGKYYIEGKKVEGEKGKLYVLGER